MDKSCSRLKGRTTLIRPLLTLVAVAVIRDAESNSISAFSILDGIVPVSLPLFMQNLSFLVFWRRDQQDPADMGATFTVSLNGNALATQVMSVNFGNGLRHRTVANLGGLVVPASGPLTFSLRLDNEVLAEYVVDVVAPQVQVNAPQPPPNPAL
jgi:hypothetical protein